MHGVQPADCVSSVSQSSLTFPPGGRDKRLDRADLLEESTL